MSSSQDASFPDPFRPRLNHPSNSEASHTYPHQALPRRSHSDRSQPRSANSYSRDNDLPPIPHPDLSSEARRQSLTAADRKRRLTASAQETGRRRTTTGGFTNRDNRFYHTPSTPRHGSHSQSLSGPGPSPVAGPDPSQIIDLTGSSPPAPARSVIPPRPHPMSFDSTRSYIVPRWQPDADVPECPICQRQFTFLFRRHHCRKCGRVVCNECSPHRITIPRQYIVHPPGEEEGSSTDTVNLSRDGGEGIGPNHFQSRMLGGGEKVRLCNPCVPDPQPELQSIFNQSTSRPLPPAPPHSSSRFPLHSPTSPISRYPPQILPPGQNLDGREPPLPQLPHPGTRMRIDSDDDDDDDMGASYDPHNGPSNRHSMGMPPQPRYHPNAHSHFRYHSLDATRAPLPPLPFNNRPRMQAVLDASRRYYANIPPNLQSPPNVPLFSPSSSSSSAAAAALAPRPPRPRIREEDLCPVCRGILPPKGPDGDESDRETHIMSCITQHDSSSQPSSLQQRARSSTQTSTLSNVTSSGLIPQAPISASLPTSPPPQRMMPMQMLRFVATEKDCGAKSDGADTNAGDVQPQECSICMVEYEVGERLVRLECWCKFHEECIVEWFGRKRECPVHKLA